MDSWDEMVNEERKEVGDLSPTVGCTLSPAEMSVKFDSGFGGHEGKPFYLWSEERVYFAVVYDGAEWVGSVPRSPQDPLGKPITHIGGE